MKKLITILVAVSLIASCAFAAADTAKLTKVKCAVTGEVIGSPSMAGAYDVYKGHTYYFCCTHCLAKFKATPATYAKPSVAYPADAPHPKPGAMKMAPGSM